MIGRGVRSPEAQRRRPEAGGDALGEDLVECDLRVRVEGRPPDEPPRVVAPGRRAGERPSHDDADRLGGDAHELGVLWDRDADGVRDLLGGRGDGDAVEGGVDGLEDRVRLEEEVAGDACVGDPPVDLLEIGDDELRSLCLVLCVRHEP